MRCPQCGREFETARGLSNHRRAHQTKPTCPVCRSEVRYLFPHVRLHAVDMETARDTIGALAILSEQQRGALEAEKVESVRLRTENLSLLRQLHRDSDDAGSRSL